MIQAHATLADTILKEAQKGNVTPAFDLLKGGADPNVPDRLGFSALARAAQFDCVELVHALIAAGSNVNHANRWGATPLMIAKSGEVAEALIAAGAALDAVTVPNGRGLAPGQTALMQAAQMNRLPVVAVLLAHGAAVNLRDGDGRNALMLAAMNGHEQVVQALVADGADVGIIEAALLGNIPVLIALIKAGDSLDADQMNAALWWAAGRGQNESIAVLLDGGADVDSRQAQGKTALMYAAMRGRAETVDTLLQHGATVDAVDERGKTALLWSQEALQGSQVGIVRTLLHFGASVDQESRTGWTPLIAAALCGATDCAQVLIEHGADVNAVNGIDEDGVGGCTALTYAIMNSRTALVDLLIRSGADVNAKGLGSRTPLEMARQRMRRPGFDEDILERLERAGAA